MPTAASSARDEWGFDWLVQFFAHRGFAVLQPNYRGSARFGTKWSNGNAFRSWQTAIGDVNDAGCWLIAQGITTPDKLGIFGWSAQAAMRLAGAVLDPDLFKAAAGVAPVTDLDMLASGSRILPITGWWKTNWAAPRFPPMPRPRRTQRFKAPVLMFRHAKNVNVAESGG
jgi:dipeptidyl aminopeptidase/acylaminoacyl peptidase